MKKRPAKDARSVLRRELREAAENYWAVLASRGWSQDQVNDRATALARISLRLHFFEQGRRSARR